MVVSWKVWKERNAGASQNNGSTTMMVISKIKEEVALWSLAGLRLSVI
jgi:hypothetical protein